jgi:hypothetical protein
MCVVAGEIKREFCVSKDKVVICFRVALFKCVDFYDLHTKIGFSTVFLFIISRMWSEHLEKGKKR